MPNLFPTTTPTDQTPVGPETQPPQVQFGRSWAFDFDAGEFVLTPTGGVQELTGKDAWVMWCMKAVRTARYTYPIYSRNYGEEYETLIGKALPRAAVESEIRRITIETLMTDPRTASVSNFQFNWIEDGVQFTCEIANVLGETAQVQNTVVIPA